MNGPLKIYSTQIIWKMRLLCESKCAFYGFTLQLQVNFAFWFLILTQKFWIKLIFPLKKKTFKTFQTQFDLFTLSSCVSIYIQAVLVYFPFKRGKNRFVWNENVRNESEAVLDSLAWNHRIKISSYISYDKLFIIGWANFSVW